jgi:hypothetical protein
VDVEYDHGESRIEYLGVRVTSWQMATSFCIQTDVGTRQTNVSAAGDEVETGDNNTLPDSLSMFVS